MKKFARTFGLVLTLSIMSLACSSATGPSATDDNAPEVLLHDPGVGN